MSEGQFACLCFVVSAASFVFAIFSRDTAFVALGIFGFVNLAALPSIPDT